MYDVERGWDIDNFSFVEEDEEKLRDLSAVGCATGPCRDKVTVAGTCQFAGEVNYFLWGRMNRLCNDLVATAREIHYTEGPFLEMRQGAREAYIYRFPDGTVYRVGSSRQNYSLESAIAAMVTYRNLVRGGRGIPGRRFWTQARI